MPTFSDTFQEELSLLLRWRRDVRHFRADPIPEDLLGELLATACLAPSVGLSQPWRFVLVDDPTRRAAIRADFEHCNAEALAREHRARASSYARLKLAGLDDAPCHLAVFAEPDPVQGHGLGRRTMPQTTAYSAVLAVHTLWLALRARGLGLGWVSILDPAAVALILDVPPAWTFIGYFCVGTPETECDAPELQTQGWEHRRGAATCVLRR